MVKLWKALHDWSMILLLLFLFFFDDLIQRYSLSFTLFLPHKFIHTHTHDAQICVNISLAYGISYVLPSKIPEILSWKKRQQKVY